MRPAILVPAYNAEDTLPELIRRIARFVGIEHIIVVDDGSEDGTARAARRAGITLLEHRTNRGKGSALRTGFDHVLRSGSFDFVVTMDADLQHRPEELPKFFEMRVRSGADVIVGARARRGSPMPLHRILSNTITSALVSTRAGVRIVDSQSGFRLLTCEVLGTVNVESDGYEAETELLIKAARKGFRIAFVPIETVYAGERSHMTPLRTTLRFLRVLMRKY